MCCLWMDVRGLDKFHLARNRYDGCETLFLSRGGLVRRRGSIVGEAGFYSVSVSQSKKCTYWLVQGRVSYY
jgi:hypothetical protein